MKYIIILFLFPVVCSAQYSQWQYESLDSMKAQREKAYQEWDKTRTHGSIQWSFNAYYRELVEWCDYKIQCYQDSVTNRYNLYSKGNKYYLRPIDIIDPGFYQGWKGDTTIIERRIPTSEGFLQHKLKTIDSFFWKCVFDN